jgi:CheY-like chemotaxis protein
MIPIRVLVVDDDQVTTRRIRDALETTGSFEVATAMSPQAGMLVLGRLQPDIMIVHPHTGRGTVAEWARAIARYRCTRSLGVIALTRNPTAAESAALADWADLGVIEHPPRAAAIGDILASWAEPEELLDRAA